MSKLEAALSWARRGFPVFPLQENGRVPLPGMSHPTEATTDEAKIRAWWIDSVTGFERDYNVGFSTSGHVVCDIDVKSGKTGLQTAKELGLDWATLVVKTPSGGYHLYYQSPGYPIGQSPLGPGVDVRSWHGYVIAPGSVVDGRGYEIALDDDPAPLPERLLPLFKRPQERREQAPLERCDSEAALAAARSYAASDAEIAVEGDHGDDVTFRVAARMRDLGVSAGAAFDILAELWNPRCKPPWDLEDLEQKVRNAYRYATGAAGLADPSTAFAEVQRVALPVYAPMAPSELYQIGNLIPVAEIKERPWLCGKLLMRRNVTTLIAAPGGGKSLMTLILACHGAVGLPFGEHEWSHPIRSIIYDAEDDTEEMSRRVHAICRFFKLDVNVVRSRIALVGADQAELVITKGKPPVINLDKVKELIARAREQRVELVGIGPLADIHTADENDNLQMQYVMAVLSWIAREIDGAVMTAHHTAKPPLVSSASWSGSLYAGRGATSVPGKARIVLTLFPASAEDVQGGGLANHERAETVKLEWGKISYGRRPASIMLQWREVMLECKDVVGVLDIKDSGELRRKAEEEIALGFISEMRHRGTGSLTAEEAFGVMRREGAASERESNVTLRNRLQRMFVSGIQTAQGLVITTRINNQLAVVVR